MAVMGEDAQQKAEGIKMIDDLVARTRSYRRFCEDVPIELETLRQLVDLARLSASAANVQPLKFALSCESTKNQAVFDCLAWAGYLKDWPGPGPGERPTGYIVILGDRDLAASFGFDVGIAAQSMMLGAVERGLGGCMFGSINHKRLREVLSLPENLEIVLVLALGKPAERVVIEPVGSKGDIKYWRDASGVHHVPKRSLDELIVG